MLYLFAHSLVHFVRHIIIKNNGLLMFSRPIRRRCAGEVEGGRRRGYRHAKAQIHPQLPPQGSRDARAG